MTTKNMITVDGTDYIRADTITPPADGNRVIIRSRDAGVFAGTLISRDGDEVELQAARRIWYWDGAATLSELATKGTSKPAKCKFPAVVPSVTVLGVCEVLPMTKQAVESIDSVPVWSQA